MRSRLKAALSVFLAVSLCGAAYGASPINNPPLAAMISLGQSGNPVSAPADTNEDTLATITVPANAMGANGCIIIDTLWTWGSSVNNKTYRVRWSGASGGIWYSRTNTTVNLTNSIRTKICNANVTNSQAGTGADQAYGNGQITGNTPFTTAVDSTAATTVVLTCQKASAGDTCTLQNYSVMLSPHS